MNWPVVPLGELLEPAPLRRAGKDEFPILSMTMRDGLVAQSEKFKKRVASRDTANYRVIKRGELVVGFPIDEAVLAVQRVVDAGIVSPAYKVWKIDSSRVDPLFLERFLRSEAAISYYKAHLRGTTARRRTLPDDKFQSMPIPLPEIDRQRRAVNLVTRADDIRQKRDQAHAMADELLQATFLHMFGHPEDPGTRFRLFPLSELSRIDTGQTPPTADPANYGSGVPFVTPGDLGDLILQTKREISEKGARASRVANCGATMVCCIGATIGKMGLATQRCAFNQQINSVTWNARVEPLFGYFALRFLSDHIARSGASTTLPILKKSLFSKIRIPVPAIEEQQKFAAIVERTWELRSKLAVERENAVSLFSSLSQRAFSGEL